MHGPDDDAQQQSVAGYGGFVHSVSHGDMHVFGDGVPVYVLRPWERAPVCDDVTLRGLPSQALDGRNRVVPFTGRAAELAELSRWRDTPPAFAVRWLFGPGGQGKSRLADEFAAASVAAGWKVVVAEPGPGTLTAPQAVHDLAVGDKEGLLLIVDYADRWPFTHLVWLFSNGLLHTGRSTRVLLVARSVDIWPALQAALRRQAGTYGMELSAQPLASLPDGTHREEMFRAAVDGFGDLYGLADRTDIAPSRSLADPELGLTLALHMMALAGVDARVTGVRAPANSHELTSCLIDREHLHWEVRYGDGTHELNPSERTYSTPPEVMHQVVFTAALTGSMSRSGGVTLVRRMGFAGEPERTLTDHETCYPPVAPGSTLEPVQPDRFAEDLLALSMPGHEIAYPARDWAPATLRSLLVEPAGQPPYLTRSLIYLVAGTRRWPHLGQAALHPLVQARPDLVVAAGNAVLVGLAAIDDLDLDLLTAVEQEFPRRPDPDVDVGVAAVAERLTDHRLASPVTPSERARLQHALAWRLANAGRTDEALTRIKDAVSLLGDLQLDDPGRYAARYRMTLNDLASCLMELGRKAEAAMVVEHVVDAYRSQPDLTDGDRLNFAGSLRSLAGVRAAGSRWKEAEGLLAEAIAIHRGRGDDLSGDAAERVEVPVGEMAAALGDLGAHFARSGQLLQAARPLEESAELYRLLAERRPTAYRAELVRALTSLGMLRSDTGRPQEGLRITVEAVTLARRLAETHPAVHLPDLATALNNVGVIRGKLGDDDGSLSAAEESVLIRRRLAGRNPDLFLSDLANSLLNCGAALFALRQRDEAIEHTKESVVLHRRLCEADPAGHLQSFRLAAGNLTGMLVLSGRWRQAYRLRRENRTAVRRFVRAGRAAASQRPRSQVSAVSPPEPSGWPHRNVT